MARAELLRRARAALAPEQAGVLGPIARFAAAAAIAGGPWISTVVALVLISIIGRAAVSTDTLAAARLVIVYAFAISLVAAAPFAVLAARMADELARSRTGEADSLPSIVLIAATVAIVAAAGAALAVAAVCGVAPTDLAVALVGLTALSAALWCAFAALSALRRFHRILAAFVVGMLASVLTGVLGAVLIGSPAAVVWGFAVGVAACAGWLLSDLVDLRPAGAGAPRRFARALRDNLATCAGATLAVAAIWIDKWVIWASSAGATLPIGLAAHPLYDSAFFIAHLSILPALSMFVSFKDGELARAIARFQHALDSRRPLSATRAAAEGAHRIFWARSTHIIGLQLVIAAVLCAAAPSLVELAQLRFDQMVIMRRGFLAVVFQSLILISSYALLTANRRLWFAAVQLLFLALNAGLTAAALELGEPALGLGTLAASMIAGLIAATLAFRATSDMLYLGFIGENPALRPRATAG